jgi:hypothetical protein
MEIGGKEVAMLIGLIFIMPVVFVIKSVKFLMDI